MEADRALHAWGGAGSSKTHLYKDPLYTHENVGWGNISCRSKCTPPHFGCTEISLDPSVPTEVIQNALSGAAGLLLNTAPLELM